MITIKIIPHSLNIFFQEYDPAQLDLLKDADIIIERTLRFGNKQELRWLFDLYGETRITTWVQEMGQYRLPERHRPFWNLLLGLEVQPSFERKAIWPH